MEGLFMKKLNKILTILLLLFFIISTTCLAVTTTSKDLKLEIVENNSYVKFCKFIHQKEQ